MTITIDWLKSKGACEEVVKWFAAQTKTGAVEVLESLIAEEKLDWANWLIVRLLTLQKRLAYAIYATDQCLVIYEGKYPEDKRPRVAIESVKFALSNVSWKNRKAAVLSALEADEAAKEAKAAKEEEAALAASAVSWVAVAESVWAVAAAWAAARFKKDMQLRILRYGIGLLKEWGAK